MAVDHRRRSRAIAKISTYTLLTIGAVFVLFPLYMAVVSSLLSTDQIAQSPPPLFPTEPQWHVYVDVFTQGDMGNYLWNSVVQSSIITIVAVTFALLAAYAFACLDFPFKKLLFALVIATIAVPFEITVTANYATVSSLGFYDSMTGLVLPFLATGFGIFMLRQAFMQIPPELREASRLDGYGDLGFFARVAAPMVRPQLAGLTLVTFLGAWNQYLWPLLQTSNDQSLRTVQIGLRSLFQNSIQSVTLYLAGSIVAIAPIMLLLIIFQKPLIANLTAGAVK